MKKAGSSNSKSKTRPTSRNTAAPAEPVATPHPLAVGHEPEGQLEPKDEALFRAFQSNLLSLISHELNTPLTGVLNALRVLAEGGPALEGIGQTELLRMALKNAEQLNSNLRMLMDLASLESGAFHLRLKELDLTAWATARIPELDRVLEKRGIKVKGADADAVPVPFLRLLDPQKLGHALDLAAQGLAKWLESDSILQLRISSSGLELSGKIRASDEGRWDETWRAGEIGHAGGVFSPTSAFAGVVQSERAFLERTEEGLGSEWGLVREILKLHSGRIEGERQGRELRLRLSLPALSQAESLRLVLRSRAQRVMVELGAVGIALIQVPAGRNFENVHEKIRKSLFRVTDSVYPLEEQNLLAVLFDDCKPEDLPVILQRIEQRIEKSLGFPLSSGFSHCPRDGIDPQELIDLAASRLGWPKASI